MSYLRRSQKANTVVAIDEQRKADYARLWLRKMYYGWGTIPNGTEGGGLLWVLERVRNLASGINQES